MWDVFISHASEDKREVAEPLAEELRRRFIKVWYDKWVLKIGDRLLEKINEGLTNSRYGIIVLSPDFLKKEWPKSELEGLVQKEIEGKKVILPVWHKVRRKDLMAFSPILAGKFAGTTENGIPALANELIEAMEDLSGNTENKIIPSPRTVDVNISFKNIQIKSDLHRYSFMCSVTLNVPPAKQSFMLKLLWPSFVRITLKNGFTGMRSVTVNGRDYKEFIYQNKQKLYPGDTIEVVSPQGRTELEYEFDHNIWDKVEYGRIELFWELFFEDQMPLKGSVDFRKLNIF